MNPVARAPVPTGGRSGPALRAAVRRACARPGLTVALAATLALAAVLYALASLRLETSTRALLPQGTAYRERYAEYDREFGELDDLVVAVIAPSPREAAAFADRLVAALAERRAPLRQVVHRIDPGQLEGHALLYLSRPALAEIRDRIFDYQDFLERVAARPTLDVVVEVTADQLAVAMATGFIDLGLDDGGGERDLTFVEEMLGAIADRLAGEARPRATWRSLFAAGDQDSDTARYFLSDDDRMLFILIEPDSAAGTFTDDRQAIEQIRATIQALRAEFPAVTAGLTGKAAVANDEMAAAFRDSRLATVAGNGLTHAVGFGGLLLADHRGIFGLGLLLTLGSLAITIASLVVLPALLRLTARPAGG